MGIILRRACQADWPDIIALHRRAAVHERRLAGFSSDDDIAAAEHGFRGELCVALSGKRLVGFAAWMGNEVAWLYVEPAWFRRGVGTMLLRTALEQCGFVAHVRVLAGNLPMLALCELQGFIRVEEGFSKSADFLLLRRLGRIEPEPARPIITIRPGGQG